MGNAFQTPGWTSRETEASKETRPNPSHNKASNCQGQAANPTCPLQILLFFATLCRSSQYCFWPEQILTKLFYIILKILNGCRCPFKNIFVKIKKNSSGKNLFPSSLTSSVYFRIIELLSCPLASQPGFERGKFRTCQWVQWTNVCEVLQFTHCFHVTFTRALRGKHMPITKESMWHGHLSTGRWSEVKLGLNPSPKAHKLCEVRPVIYPL